MKQMSQESPKEHLEEDESIEKDDFEVEKRRKVKRRGKGARK